MKWVEFAICVVCLSPVWGAFVVEIWEGIIKPRCIPQKEIFDAVEKLYADYSEDAFNTACAYEQRACHDCDSFEQGRWRRIREEIVRRERLQGYTFRKIQ